MCPKSKEQNPDSESLPPPPPAAAPVPAKVPGEGQWTTGICGCIENPCNCVLTLFCPCITFGRNAGILEKSKASCVWAGIVYTILFPLCFFFGGIPLPCCYGCAYRSKLRGKFTLPGEPCCDFLAHMCCPCCAICQEYRELENRGLHGSHSDKQKSDRRENWYHTTPPRDYLDGLSATAFTYEELERATDGFADANLLGKGGFGYVHKGVLANGRVVAVKQLGSESTQGEREFRNEIEIISRVHHRNLVSLVGYCSTGDRRLLVYEFVPNNDLQFHLHGEGNPTLDWSTRLRIAVGAAKGLAYLHEHCRPKIIHRDIKPSNILLDDHFEAKVADFGLAKYSLDTQSHISTRVVGTFGYLAPEYASTGQLTDKSDVYSFGVVLLELITGLQPVDRLPSSTGDYHASIVDRCRPLILNALEGGSYDDLVDPKLQKDYDPDQMSRSIACAAACVRHSARLRPRISQIVRALEGNMSLDELNEGTTPGFSHHESLQLEEITVTDSQELASSEYDHQPSSSSSTDRISKWKTTRDSPAAIASI